jgi:hypothetical protein
LLLLPARLPAQELLAGTAAWTDVPKDIAADQFRKIRSYYEDALTRRERMCEALAPDREELGRLTGARHRFSIRGLSAADYFDDRSRVDEQPHDAVYPKFGLQLARRGYLVFAPMISTQTVVDRNEVVRRAHPLGLTPVGMERVSMGRFLDLFPALPPVDTARIGYYTAPWTAPGEPRFHMVICPGHFNDWSVKTTDTFSNRDEPRSDP